MTTDQPHIWGRETILATASRLELKRIEIRAGWMTSKHEHRVRDQIVLVEHGRLGLRINGTPIVLKAGDTAAILHGQRHRLCAPGPGPAVVILASTAHQQRDDYRHSPPREMEDHDHAAFE